MRELVGAITATAAVTACRYAYSNQHERMNALFGIIHANPIFRSLSLKVMQFISYLLLLLLLLALAFFASSLMMLLMFVIWVNYYWLQAISKLQNLCMCWPKHAWNESPSSTVNWEFSTVKHQILSTIFRSALRWMVKSCHTMYVWNTCTQSSSSIHRTYQWSSHPSTRMSNVIFQIDNH